ncbi:hypothetical protein FC37_GL000683 [Lactobacillus gallinarum DSM 10532 = JCM 2011]|uniref:Uncharacterized protein n=1 Tax=Lactobacillus gallinarum DSM 10532 = JCM 2011 TaxID=1423748 RepID=A0A0R1NVT0_9LACO|nr:hypothetical protein FC37_GL000683 [Lactobacillus gallinarum DSM 10532 = JCM 2011]
MASIHSSAGITLVHPASAMSAEIKALPAPIAFLLTQGTSTKPAIGSQTRPSKLDIAIDIACALCSALPLAASTAAAAPMADALPTSAWQPPVAPAISALLAITRPNPPAVKRKRIICSSVKLSRFSNKNKTPGKIPEEPAVGVAQMTPIAALTSLVATAFCTAVMIVSPERVWPFSIYFLIFTASPPVKPVLENTPLPPRPFLTASRIVCKLYFILFQIFSRG